MRLILCYLFFSQILSAKPIETFYGIFEVEEPVLLELIECEAMQRLKGVHQYGVSYFTTHREEYTRYDHSLGVFALLRQHGLSLKEQIAGLLHDVSHTTFSHVGDWIFNLEYVERDYHNCTHLEFLKTRGVGEILEKYGYTVEEIQPLHELFPALECSLPDLCADRIDYNIQGAYYQGFITYEEALEIFHEITFKDGKWITGNLEIMKKLTEFSFFMSGDCWGSPINHFQSRWLADAILRAAELEEIGYDDIHFGKDHQIWDFLEEHSDLLIQNKMYMVKNPQKFCFVEFSEKRDHTIRTKFRGIDPWISTPEGHFLLSDLSSEIKEKYLRLKKKHDVIGWAVKLCPLSIEDTVVILEKAENNAPKLSSL